MLLNSKKFPEVSYNKGEEIWVGEGELGLPFNFDVTEDLTASTQAMELVSTFLDDIDALKENTIKYLKALLLKKTEQSATDSEEHILCYFLEFHRDEFDIETLKNLLGTQDVVNITLERMTDFLLIKRFGSYIDKKLNEQAFIMDLSFNSEYTDELLVIYFNKNKEIFNISHES